MTQQTQQGPVDLEEGALPGAFVDEMQKKGFKRMATEIIGWEDGLHLEGKLVEVREGSLVNADGSKAKLLEVLHAGGIEKVWSCPTVLSNRLAKVPPGSDLYIVCMGKKRTRGGQMAWAFEVFVK